MVLSRFYYQTSKKKAEQLRMWYMLLMVVTLVLLWLPWSRVDGRVVSGIGMAIDGEKLLVVYGVSLLSSLLLMMWRQGKMAVMLSMTNSVFLFLVAMRLWPETKVLETTDLAPIISELVLLNNVVGSLWWHQKEKTSKKMVKKRSIEKSY